MGKKKFSVPPAVIYGVSIAALLSLVFFGKDIFGSLRNINGKSNLDVNVPFGRAEVLVNNESIGTTPVVTSEIRPGSNKITVRSSTRQYETTIDFLSNNNEYIHTVGVYRDLGISDLFSSGQDVWFEEDTTNTVLRIISEPSGASVYIDGTIMGKTPFTSSTLSEGDYDLRIENVGYENEETRIRIQKGYTSNISAKLFPMPVMSKVSKFEGSDNLYDLSSDNSQIISDPATWARAAVYWNQTRGINLEGVGINRELIFDYFIDFQGNLYNELGDRIEKLENYDKNMKGGYLGRVSDGYGLTEPAKNTVLSLTGTSPEESGKFAKILETGTGWLRVRSAAGINSTELGRADVGKEYPLLEEQTEWAKIQLSDTVQGWVSKTYIEIVEKGTAPAAQSAQQPQQQGPQLPQDGTGATTPTAGQ